MRKIVWTDAKGRTCIDTPNSTIAELFGEDIAEQVAWDALNPDAIKPRWVDESEIPTDRTFRDALKPDLTYDMDKARLIAQRLLDTTKKPITLSPEVMAAKTPEDLKALS